MGNFNYIDIPLMINIHRSAKPKAISDYKVNWYCFLALYDNIYHLDDYLQVAYYIPLNIIVSRCIVRH